MSSVRPAPLSSPNKIFSLDETRQWFNNLAVRQSVGVVFQAENQVFLVKPNYRDYWVWPGGMIDERETPEQAAIREVKEELGIKIERPVLAYHNTIPPHDGFLDAKSFSYLLPVADKAAFLQSIKLNAQELDVGEFVSYEEALVRMHPIEAAAFQSYLQAPSGPVLELVNGQ